MKKRTVKELMVPLSAYATVSEASRLADTVAALKASQQRFGPSRYPHRAVLVIDDKGRVSGKIDPIDLLKALEPKSDHLQSRAGMAHLVFTKKFIRSMLTSYNLWETPMEEICRMSSMPSRRSAFMCMKQKEPEAHRTATDAKAAFSASTKR